MGGTTSEPIPIETPEELTPQLPVNAAEAGLFNTTLAECTWKDANEYSFRLRQIELLNFSIKTISKDISKPADQLDFQKLHAESIAYKNAFGKEDEVHPWDILALDPLFIPADKEITFFKSYADYFVENSGASNSVHKDRFEQFLQQFIRLRDRIMQYMSKNCVSNVVAV